MISCRDKPVWVVGPREGEHCNIDGGQNQINIFYVDWIGWEFLLSLYSTNARSLLLSIGDVGTKYILIYVIVFEGFRNIVFRNRLRNVSLNKRDQCCRVHLYHWVY